jgi:hypothetical protein
MYSSTISSVIWTDADWEMLWAPYSDDTYHEVLRFIQPEDVVLEIGAGDMRLSILLANKARYVYAFEIHHFLVEKAIPNRVVLQDNLTILNYDARNTPFPEGVTAAVLLMRHCTHFRLYADKLKTVGCKKLITNARWRMGLEAIDLQAPRHLFDQITMGWYACWCGNTGFKNGLVEDLNEEIINSVHEVSNCPNCS